MAENYATRFQAVEKFFPPQEINPKEIARQALKIAQGCAAALAEDWHAHASPRVMAGLCAMRTTTAVQ